VVGTRQPGELYTNWPDRQIGVIDSTQAPMDLVAVRFFSSLASYNAGDFVLSGGQVYSAKAAVVPGAFNATQWNKVTLASDTGTFLPLSGGTLTGLLTAGGATGIAIQPPAGQSALLQLYKPASGYGCQINTFTGSNMRWSQQMGDSTAETGSDTGSNYSLYNFKDNGTYQIALSITRATGLATVAGDPTAGLGIATKQYVDKAPRLIQSGSVSNVANIVFSFPGGYSTYRLIMNRLEPVTAAVALYGFVSVNNNVSYYQAAGNYNWAGKFVVYSGTEGIWTSSAQFSSGFGLTAGNMAAASGAAAFWIMDIYPGSGSNLGTILWKCYYGGVWYAGGGALVATGAVWTNFLVLFSSGNIAGCGYQLYGMV
jgi:hypothetical protein